jgi:hypothetical protein
MSIRYRTLLATGAGLVIWTFFYVPNRSFYMFKVQGLGERMPLWALFAVIPFMLGLLVTALLQLKGWATALVVLSVPIAGVAACLLLWATGYYSDEDLLGAWLLLPAIPAYVLGVPIGLWLRSCFARKPTNAL